MVTPVGMSGIVTVQDQIQADWDNRELIQVITTSIMRIAHFLNNFDMSARSRLAQLNEKLTTLERKIEYLEARVSGEDLNRTQPTEA